MVKHIRVLTLCGTRFFLSLTFLFMEEIDETAIDETAATPPPRNKFRLPAYLRNKYFIATAAFVVWVAFLDRNNLIATIQLQREVNKRESQKEFYIKEIEQTKTEAAELLGSPDKLEKFAREKYHMKRDDEDLFIFSEKK